MMASFKDRKLSFRHKAAPVVRQTKTSIYRTLKANPLMLCDQEDMKKIGIQDVSKIPKSVDVLGIVTSDESKLKLMMSDATHDEKSVKFSTTSFKCPNNLPSTKRNVNNIIVQTKKENNKNEIQKHPPVAQKKQTTIKPPIRESISSMHRNKMLHLHKRRSKSAEKFEPTKYLYKEHPTKHDHSMSMDNINKLLENDHSPIRKDERKVIFKTPIAYNRRSVTPMTSFQSTPAPSDLQNRLNAWLIQKGKSINNFHHLKCFGLHKMKELVEDIELTEEDKENMEIESISHIKSNPINYNLIARNALDDLHKLIEEGYPINLCETWLGRIREKYSQLEEEPLYWECRAALEQVRGNITTAVDHYRQAIVQGAEVHTIEESLDHLLEKFSLLHIDTTTNAENSKNNRIILDARNAFKSTVIKFAVQERTIKKKGERDQKQHMTITPVRRSTRLSLNPINTTPGVKLCDSLKEMDMNDNIKFQKNSYL